MNLSEGAQEDIFGEGGLDQGNTMDISSEAEETGENEGDISDEEEWAQGKGSDVSGEDRGTPAATGREGLSLLTQPLGLYGWKGLETVLLAAVASETPLLLVGAHGCAKSFFLEKLAGVLELNYRFYNASLINYDDLVGIPVPSEDRKRLEYITTPTAIWDAEVVFLDEINRTRPELQNKLFPIIHERRVQGIPLKRLRFRWAAMNPPAEGAAAEEVDYVGAEPLDTALADRFGFIVEVPAWKDLSFTDQMSVLQDGCRGSHPFPVRIDQIIEACRSHLEMLRRQALTELCSYMILLWNELAKLGVFLSTRRMTMLYENILAVHAARFTLNRIRGSRQRNDWSTSAWQAVEHSLPQRAQGALPDRLQINAAHLQAWTLMNKNRGIKGFALLTIPDALERACAALQNRDTLNAELVTSALINFLSEEETATEKHVRALALYAATEGCYTPEAPVLDAMAEQLDSIFTPGTCSIDMPLSDHAWLSGLGTAAPEGITPRDRTLRHYANNLSRHLYDITRDTRESEAAADRFHLLRDKLTRAVSGNREEDRHE